jgi:hypothetical protein
VQPGRVRVQAAFVCKAFDCHPELAKRRSRGAQRRTPHLELITRFSTGSFVVLPLRFAQGPATQDDRAYVQSRADQQPRPACTSAYRFMRFNVGSVNSASSSEASTPNARASFRMTVSVGTFSPRSMKPR